jgi:hypothetical protein
MIARGLHNGVKSLASRTLHRSRVTMSNSKPSPGSAEEVGLQGPLWLDRCHHESIGVNHWPIGQRHTSPWSGCTTMNAADRTWRGLIACVLKIRANSVRSLDFAGITRARLLEGSRRVSALAPQMINAGWYTELSPMWPGQGLTLKIKEVLHRAKSEFQVGRCAAYCGFTYSNGRGFCSHMKCCISLVSMQRVMIRKGHKTCSRSADPSLATPIHYPSTLLANCEIALQRR